MEGYKEAAEIGKRITRWGIQDPITKENALNWLNFIRTVGTTILLIEAICIKELKLPRGE